MLHAKFSWNLPSDSGEEDEKVKSYDNNNNNDDDNKDDGQILIIKAHLSNSTMSNPS